MGCSLSGEDMFALSLRSITVAPSISSVMMLSSNERPASFRSETHGSIPC